MSWIKSESAETLKGVFIAYIVLLLHVILVAFALFLVLFFHGMINHMMWFFFASLVFGFFVIYYCCVKIRLRFKKIMKVFTSPSLGKCSVEIDFLGGLASFKLRQISERCSSNNDSDVCLSQIESLRVDEVIKLARLLEKKIVAVDGYDKAKGGLVKI